MTTASLARTRRVDGTSALGPQPAQALLAASPHVRCDVPEQELRRFPLPACTALSRLFADGLVIKWVSIRSQGLGGRAADGESGGRGLPRRHLRRRHEGQVDYLLLES